MTENALKGVYNGGKVPFGYMIDDTRHYQADPLTGPYVEKIFQKYADGAEAMAGRFGGSRNHEAGGR